MQKKKPARVQPSGGGLGMSYRPKHSKFESPLGIPLDYLIHGSSVWGRVSMVYYPRMGPKRLALVRFHVIKKSLKKKKKLKIKQYLKFSL